MVTAVGPMLLLLEMMCLWLDLQTLTPSSNKSKSLEPDVSTLIRYFHIGPVWKLRVLIKAFVKDDGELKIS